MDVIVAVHHEPVSTERGGFPVDAFEYLPRVEQRHYAFESRSRLIVWAMSRSCYGARTSLEASCGTDLVLQGIHEAFPALPVTASDALSGGLAIAATRVPTAGPIRQGARAATMRLPRLTWAVARPLRSPSPYCCFGCG